MKHKKENRKSADSKSRKKSKLKKRSKEKKQKREKRCDVSSSSGSSSDNGEQEVWVEKTSQPSSVEGTQKAREGLEPLKRDEWMNLNSTFPCMANPSNVERKKSQDADNKEKKYIFDKPGQSGRELNPYWKNGGNGLPQVHVQKSERRQTVDASWLKKSLTRATEQAIEEGKTLDEIATERWGSLETIQSMIATAEVAGSTRNSRCSHSARGKRSISDLQNSKKQSYGGASYYKEDRHRSRSRSRSRSQSRDRHDRCDQDANTFHEKRRKQQYKKPAEHDDFIYATHKTNNKHNRVKNWQKRDTQDLDSGQKSTLTPTDMADSDSKLQSEKKREQSTSIEKVKPLAEAEMNKLGARIVKAEIMGDTELAAKLKIQLENARKISIKLGAPSNNTEIEENVILTRTDARGIERPLEPRSEGRVHSDTSRKRKSMQTHVDGQRVRHFFDDDKYSLDQLFQREKGRGASEDDAVFTKAVSKRMDMNDIFEEQITRVQSDSKQDEKDRMHAIREHSRKTKSLDNCRWCIDSKNMLKHMIITMDPRICLSLPSHVSLTEGHCVLTPVHHTACQLQLDEDVWERLKVFKRILWKMYSDNNQYPVFFEIYKNRHKFPHMQLECIPLPKEIGGSAPMYFKKALLECETEWSVNKKIIDLKKKDVRRAVPNGLAYFAVEFGLEEGFAHVIENEDMFPKNFAEEIIGGMLDLDHGLWRKPRRENFDQQRAKVLKFSEMWKKYDEPIRNDTN